MKLFYLMRSIYLFALLFLIFSNSYAGKKTFNGYYVTTSGDTIKGVFLGYKQWNYNPSSVDFIPEGATNIIMLTPANSREFSITGYDTYVAYKGVRMTSPTEYTSFTSDQDTTTTYDTVTTFLRQIVATRNYTFWGYKDKLRSNYFYFDGNTFTELLQSISYSDNVIKTSEQYKKQLALLFAGRSTSADINKVSYNEESLRAYVNSFREGSEHSAMTKDKNNGFVVTAGTSLNNFAFKGMLNESTAGVYKSSIAPVIGIGYISTSRRQFGKLFLFPQLKISYYKNSATFGTQITNTFKAATIISLSVSAGYNFINRDNFKAFVAPAVVANYFINPQQVNQIKYSESNIHTTTTKIRNFTETFGVNAGVLISKKYMIWINYLLPQAVTNYSQSKSSLSSIQFGIGYKL